MNKNLSASERYILSSANNAARLYGKAVTVSPETFDIMRGLVVKGLLDIVSYGPAPVGNRIVVVTSR